MRKLSQAVFFSSILLAATPILAGGPDIIVEPDYFSGFFIGVTGAFHATGFSGSASASSINDVVVPVPVGMFTVSDLIFSSGTISTNISSNSYDGYYGVHGGVGKVFYHRWYAGVVGFGEWGSQDSTVENSVPFAGAVVPTPPNGLVESNSGNYQSETTLRLSNNWGVAFRPGFLVTPGSMVYGKIGATWANAKISNMTDYNTNLVTTNPDGSPVIKNDVNLTGKSSAQQQKIALLLGVGYEQFIYKNFLTFNVEYNYANYGHVSTSTLLSGTADTTLTGSNVTSENKVSVDTPIVAKASASAKVNTLLGGLNFYFGNQWF